MGEGCSWYVDLPRTHVPSNTDKALNQCFTTHGWKMSTNNTRILDRTRCTHFLYLVTGMLSWNKMGDALGLGALSRRHPQSQFLSTAGKPGSVRQKGQSSRSCGGLERYQGQRTETVTAEVSDPRPLPRAGPASGSCRQVNDARGPGVAQLPT